MATKVVSHNSPVFANKYWADDEGYLSYFYCPYKGQVTTGHKGKKQWGRKKGLYSLTVENSLSRDLETKVSPIYEKIISFNEISTEERMIFSQFLMSQLVRTPTFMRYEDAVRNILKIQWSPLNDRVGCTQCEDVYYFAKRDWFYLLAHDDDYFVRSDNPVLLSGFVERHETCLYYPLTPRICFVACSMPEDWCPFCDVPKETVGYYLEKGVAQFINFHLARTASESLIIKPSHDSERVDAIITDMLGRYPQPPFSLLRLHTNSPSISEKHISDINISYEKVRKLMELVDGVSYPSWIPFELEPFYRDKKK